VGEPGGVHRGPVPAHVVGPAVQNLAAARLARGFVPLAVLFLSGVALTVTSSGVAPRGLALTLGAPAAGAATLAYGLRAVQRAFGRPPRPWMSVAALAGVVPPAFAVWVMGWLGLRGLTAWGHPGPMVMGLAWTWLGAWVLTSWLRVHELDRLATAMGPMSGADAEGAT